MVRLSNLGLTVSEVEIGTVKQKLYLLTQNDFSMYSRRTVRKTAKKETALSDHISDCSSNSGVGPYQIFG